MFGSKYTKYYTALILCICVVSMVHFSVIYVSKTEIGLILKHIFRDGKINNSNGSIYFFCPVNNTNISYPCLCATEEISEIFNEELIISNVDRRIFMNLKCAMTFLEGGRLGNVMGEYATLYTLAKLNRRPAFMTPKMAAVLKPYFKVTIPALSKQLHERIPWTRYEISKRMEENYTKFEQLFLQLEGYPSSYSFLHQFEEEIKNEFTLRDEFYKNAQAILQNITVNRTSVTFVGVHVRRGDYVHLMAHQYHGVLAEKQYFVEATDYFRSRYSNVIFIVVSNDMKWCEENIPNDKNDLYFVGNNNEMDPITDFAILMNCNHSIITVGTYSFFSAYLAGGDTVYLTNYTMYSKWNKFFDWDTAFPPRWHPIAADLTPQLKKLKTKLN